TAGTYILDVFASDSCETVGTDAMAITVQFNSAPSVIFNEQQTAFKQCNLAEICLSVDITDIDANITEVVLSDPAFAYDAAQGTLCFTPTSYGQYCITATATDACGELASAQLCIEVLPGDSVSIACPPPMDTTVQLCEIDTVRIPLPIEGAYDSVMTDFGIWGNDTLYFLADSAVGQLSNYTITVIADAQCISDTCVVVVPVMILEELWISCPPDTAFLACEPETLCLDLSYAVSATNVTASGDAYIDGNSVCIPILEDALLEVVLTAEGQCGFVSCTVNVDVILNTAPYFLEPVSAEPSADSSLTVCEFTEICIPFSVGDRENNIASITGPAFGTIVDSAFCFTPTEFGSFSVILDCIDSCGLMASDTSIINVLPGDSAFIECIDDPFVSICDPGQISIPITITPANAVITVLPASLSGAYINGEIVVNVASAGSHPITIIAEAQCSSDTCEFTLHVEMPESPQVIAPDSLYELLCLASPTTYSFDVDVLGTISQVNVNPIGIYDAGQVTFDVDTAGVYVLEVIASGPCGVDSNYTKVVVDANEEPQLTMPALTIVDRCPSGEDTICVSGFAASDAESPVTVTLASALGQFDQALGELCFLPDDTLGLYQFIIDYTDGCHSLSDTYFVQIDLRPDCDVCVRFTIDPGTDWIPVGLRKEVPVFVESNDEIGGYDLLISFDASALTFVGASKAGSATADWEYFTYNLDNHGCGNACPSGLVRFVSIADVNNGGSHPPQSAYEPNGLLLTIEFQVANDQNLGGNFVPINFVWYDCGDNSAASRSGEILFVDRRIYNAEGILIWDETDDVTYPEASRPFGMGAEEACMGLSDKGEPLRCVEFFNGGVNIVDPEIIDDRGDINLDGLAYTVADAVMFTNYFIYGLAAFPNVSEFSVQGAIAASDVNADGLTLTVADLVYLIRVVVGDAFPIPRLNPYESKLLVETKQADGVASVTTESIAEIGAVYLVYEFDANLNLEQPILRPEYESMSMQYSIVGSQMKILIYDIGQDRIESGLNNIIEIPYQGDGALRLIEAQASDYNGRPYDAVSRLANVPDHYSLEQNYPNPFNPSTTISFALPAPDAWTMEIYNITGARVRSFTGSSTAGVVTVVWDGRSEQGTEVASGVYFYRLQTGDFKKTKKMMLLK
ncbi:MAG: T9SS type A sorting domain-containing protein, partial [candidate division Zixibacteria bacterium]